MNIHKVLNIPDKKQNIIINGDIKIVIRKCDAIAKMEYKELLENNKIHDSQCSICKNTKVINKISHVQGKTSIVNNFKFGFGSITTNTTIDTVEVNHCTNCGNEWIKSKVKYITGTDILRVALNYLAQIIINPEEKKKEWKLEAIQVFNDCCAESIYRLRVKNEEYLLSDTNSKLNLRVLRKYYESVYDSNKNKKKLEKL